jgi:hypothetical protein
MALAILFIAVRWDRDEFSVERLPSEIRADYGWRTRCA